MHSQTKLRPDLRTQKQAKNEILTGSLGRSLYVLFLPLFLSLCLSSLIGIADMYLASFLGPQAQAAIGIGDQVIFLLIICGTALGTASCAYVSYAYGAGKHKLSLLFARDSLLLGTIFGIAATVFGICGTETIIGFFQPPQEVAELAVSYLRLSSWANGPFIIALCQTAIFRAMGKPAAGVYLWLITSVITIGGSFYGFFCLPKPWGRSLDTLAITWSIGCFIGMLFGFVLFHRITPLRTRKVLLLIKNTSQRLRFLLKTGTPVVFSELSAVLSQFLLYRLIAGFNYSSELQAAWTIRMKLEETIALIPLLCLGMSTAVIVGQNFGAGQKQAAKVKTLQIALLGTFLMLLTGIGLAGYAEPMAKLFSADSHTIEAVRILFASGVFLLPCTALCSILNAALEGAGITSSPMYINLVGLLLGRVGLSYCLSCPCEQALEGIINASYVSAAFMALAALACFIVQFKRS